MLARRQFLVRVGTALAAPAIIRTAGILMPIRPLLDFDMDDVKVHCTERFVSYDLGYAVEHGHMVDLSPEHRAAFYRGLAESMQQTKLHMMASVLAA
jgi:hypothetical protein